MKSTNSLKDFRVRKRLKKQTQQAYTHNGQSDEAHGSCSNAEVGIGESASLGIEPRDRPYYIGQPVESGRRAGAEAKHDYCRKRGQG